jgi:hypothetical protein
VLQTHFREVPVRRALASGLLAILVSLLLAAEAGVVPREHVEVTRIQGHLSQVARAMRAGPTAHLTEEQREARQAALTWLEEYRTAGVFPHNHVRPGQRVPVFVDPHGTPCAVGYLMLRSGHDDLVEDIVRTDNLVRVHDLRDDARLGAWLEAHGITLAEAALIQPGYDYIRPPSDPVPASSHYRPATVGFSLATAALASYTAMLGADRGTPWVDALALGTTMGHAYLILSANDTYPEEPTWAVGLNVVGLVASVGSEIFRIARRGDTQGQVRESAAVQAYVVPGRNGTEVVFAIPTP